MIQCEGARFCIDCCWELVEWPLNDGAGLAQAERWWLHHHMSVCPVNLKESFILSLAILILVSLIFPNLDPNGGDYVWNKKPGECVDGIFLSRRNKHKYWTEVEWVPFRCQEIPKEFYLHNTYLPGPCHTPAGGSLCVSSLTIWCNTCSLWCVWIIPSLESWNSYK